MRPRRVVLAGLVALGVAMGIGRFAFTPLLPLMLADGLVDLAGASWLASANYAGYLLGALLCTVQPWLWRRFGAPGQVHGPTLVRVGLAGTVLLTLAMALQAPLFWPGLRFAAGLASALVFIYTSGWCLAQLASMRVPALGALIYVGPGVGIVLSGLAASALVGLQGSAALGWLVFGLLAGVLTSLVWPVFGGARSAPAGDPAAASRPAEPRPPGDALEVTLLAVAYGLAGFGYIITATFLPVIARAALPGSPWLDLFWPLFGAGIIAGALAASRVSTAGDLRLALAGCYAVQALGIGIGIVSPSLWGFALGSLLLGLPFTAITFFAMQEVRRIRAAQPASAMGLLTAMYGTGQIAGPAVAAALLARSGTPGQGFTLSLQLAMGALLLGVALYAALVRAFPLPAGGHAP